MTLHRASATVTCGAMIESNSMNPYPNDEFDTVSIHGPIKARYCDTVGKLEASSNGDMKPDKFFGHTNI